MGYFIFKLPISKVGNFIFPPKSIKPYFMATCTYNTAYNEVFSTLV
ncbi:hypothetical protein F3D3_2213 [Fusibacter sp. 3D3]|nr:hypothetical protein F3D3_2213 [Fusibacter sp. 3D3]